MLQDSFNSVPGPIAAPGWLAQFTKEVCAPMRRRLGGSGPWSRQLHLTGVIASYKGMNCGEGAEGVGRAAIEAVVFASIPILFSNVFLTLFLNRVTPQL
jgi:hypothetical protein